MILASQMAMLCINCLRPEDDKDIDICIKPRYVHNYDIGYTFASDTFQINNKVHVNYHLITNENEYIKTIRVEWDSDNDLIIVIYTSTLISEEQVFGVCTKSDFSRNLWNFSDNKCRFSCSIDYIIEGQKICKETDSLEDMFKKFIYNTKLTNIEIEINNKFSVKLHGGEVTKISHIMNTNLHQVQLMLHPKYLCYTLDDPEVETELELRYFDNDIAFFKFIDLKHLKNRPIMFAYTKEELKKFGVQVCKCIC